MSPTNSQMQKEETKRNLHQVEAGLSRAGCFSHPPLIGTPTSTCSPDGKTVKSMDSCWTSRSPSDSSLLWLALVFLGIHSFQSRQVFGRTGLWRRLRFIYSYKMMCLFFFFFCGTYSCLPEWVELYDSEVPEVPVQNFAAPWLHYISLLSPSPGTFQTHG